MRLSRRCYFWGLFWLHLLLSSLALSQSPSGRGIAGEKESAVSNAQKIHIRVLDGKDLGARVLVELLLNGSRAASAYTDWSGNVTFRGIVPGKYTLAITVPGQVVYHKDLNVQEGQNLANAVLRIPNVVFTSETGKAAVNDLRAPPKAYRSYLEGMDAMRSGNPEEALLRLDDALKIYPAHSKSHNARGVALHMLNRNEEAEAEFRAAARFDAKSFEPQFNLGKLLLDSHRPFEARAVLQRAFDLDKENVATAELLTDSMLMMHNTEPAILLAKSLDRRGLKYPARVHLQIASELSKEGMLKPAAEQYRLALEGDPSLPERHEAETALSLMGSQGTHPQPAD
jgi:tetratricopeptide (TPR) repeat protein